MITWWERQSWEEVQYTCRCRDQQISTWVFNRHLGRVLSLPTQVRHYSMFSVIKTLSLCPGASGKESRKWKEYIVIFSFFFFFKCLSKQLSAKYNWKQLSPLTHHKETVEGYFKLDTLYFAVEWDGMLEKMKRLSKGENKEDCNFPYFNLLFLKALWGPFSIKKGKS